MTDASVPRSPELPPPSRRPTLRERWARRPPSLGFLVGAGMLAVYLVAALSALVVFRGSLDQLPQNVVWVPLENPIGPSAAHPFGIMAGFGTDLFRAVWQATPWDLAIVAGILAIDVFLGFFLGAIAGLNEGGIVDAFVTFVSDSLGTIPTFLLAVVVFAGLLTVAPQAVGLSVFVVVFGIILWPTMARTVRERARIISHAPYVEAARASGASFPRILVRHIMSNSVGPGTGPVAARRSPDILRPLRLPLVLQLSAARRAPRFPRGSPAPVPHPVPSVVLAAALRRVPGVGVSPRVWHVRGVQLRGGLQLLVDVPLSADRHRWPGTRTRASL